jgi:menaquinone-dependent protoporphyrinogen oxidase
VLVAVGSKHGATQEIAEAIGRVLEESGHEADVWPVEEVESPAPFDAVVLGSAVYVGSWLQPAREFVDEHAAVLADRPTWLFSSGPIGDPPRPDEEHAVQVDEIRTKTAARDHRLFAGRLDKSLLGFGERAVVLAFRAVEGDFRDWEEIEAWAREIAGSLDAVT